MKFGSKEIKPIIRRREPLTQEQISEAFAVGENTLWYVALVQILENAGKENLANSASAITENNPMLVSRYIGAWEEDEGLLLMIETLRQENAD